MQGRRAPGGSTHRVPGGASTPGAPIPLSPGVGQRPRPASGEPPPTQKSPQAGDLASVLEADVKNEATVVRAHEADVYAGASYHCGRPPPGDR